MYEKSRGRLAKERTSNRHLVRNRHEDCAGIRIGTILDPVTKVIAAFDRLLASAQFDITIVPSYDRRLIDCDRNT